MAVSTITEQASDFTSRSFDAWVLELRSRSNTAFPGWTDYNTPNFGNILLEMFAHTLDVVSFYQDQQFLETRITFANLRRSMIALGRNVGFRLPGATVSSVDLEITIADGLARTSDLVIPAGTVVRTQDLEDPAEFDLLADATIPAGSIQVTGVPAENARAQTQNFVSVGDPSFPVILAQVPYVDESAVVVVGVDTYTEVDNFFNSGPSDKHFTVSVDEDDRATVTFGDGINGSIPSGAGTVDYKTGGGSLGNVDANTLVEFRDTARFPLQVGSEQVQLTVRNPSAASGGVDRMSVEEARVAIPASLSTTGNRSVTQGDFEANARKERGVARAMMLTADDVSSIAENTGKLYIIPVGGGLPSSTLKAAVLDLITTTYPPTLTFTFTVEDPDLLVVSIVATVYLAQGVSEANARAAIESAYEDFFSLLNSDGSQNDQIDFGFKIRTDKMGGAAAGELPWSDLFNTMRNAALADGTLVLRKIEEDSFTPLDDVPLGDTEFPILGTITLTNGDTSLAF